MNQQTSQVHYELRLVTTDSATGYFSCQPEKKMSFENSLSYLREHPNDEFMHKELLSQIAAFENKKIKKLIHTALKDDPLLLSLLYEATLLHEKFHSLQPLFPKEILGKLSSQTPLIYIKSSLQEDQQTHFEWIKMLRDNLLRHQPLPPPDRNGLPPLFEKDEIEPIYENAVSIQQVVQKMRALQPSENTRRIDPSETVRRAIERLENINVFADIEKRHVSSLSPIALLRQWRLNLSIQNGRHNYTLKGTQSSYGKGLSLDAARASCSMEIVERCSSFASFKNNRVIGYSQDYPLTRARFSELAESKTEALNPNQLELEVPYNDEPLYWIEGTVHDGRNLNPILVPAQCVFLFCNLDEIKLFSGPGSTGLASGNTLEEAKISALLEALERDAENTTPYDPAFCFQIVTEEPQLASLLDSYRSLGIHIQFQDLTSPLGVPCCKCFVVGLDGQIHKGTGAHLNAKKALLSALTETTYPYPYGPPSRPGLEKTTIVPVENLPDYSTGDAACDLSLLETLLTANDYNPIYVNLTRKDLDIPVVKAIVPGLELTSDFDRFSRVNPRLYRNYLKLFQHQNRSEA